MSLVTEDNGTAATTDDIFANSSSETVKENMDYSDYISHLQQLLCKFDYKQHKPLNPVQDKGVTNKAMPLENKKMFHSINNCFGTSTNLKCDETAGGSNTLFPFVPADAQNLSDVATQVASEASNFPRRVFCPFCAECYTHEFTLKLHMKEAHETILNLIAQHKYNEFTLEICPACQSRFYMKGILSKHLIYDHQECVVNMLQEEYCEDTGDLYVNCKFCPYRVLRRHIKVLMIHIDKRHNIEFDSFLQLKLSEQLVNHNTSFYDNVSVQPLPQSSTPGISNVFEKLSTVDTSVENRRLDVPEKEALCLIGNEECNMNEANEIEHCAPGILKRRDKRKKCNVRRELRFSIPEVIGVPGEDFKENISKNLQRKNKKGTITKTKIKKKRGAIPRLMSLFVGRDRKKGLKDNNLRASCEFLTSTPVSKSSNISRKIIGATSTPIRGHEELSQIYSTKALFPLINVNQNVHERDSKHTACGSIASSESMDVPGNFSEYSPYAAHNGPSEKFITDPNPVISEDLQYRCGRCSTPFTSNACLLSHIRHSHLRLLRLFHPLYKCGSCEAAFYRNNFLLRHCQLHHTPRCLRIFTGDQ